MLNFNPALTYFIFTLTADYNIIISAKDLEVTYYRSGNSVLYD